MGEFIMGLQPFYGNEISEEVTAGADLEYYIITKYHGSDKTKVIPATAGSVPLAVTVPSEDDRMPDGNGNMIKRTKYKTGETPTLYDEGTVWVKLGETVQPGQECVPGQYGYGYAKDDATFTDKVAADFDTWALGATPTGTEINAVGNNLAGEVITETNSLVDEIQAAIALEKTVLGRFRRGGDAGDIVPVKIN